MRKNENRESIQGRIYEHDLEIKKVTNESSKNFGTEYISGNIHVAVDEDLLNVIPVHFTYVTEVTASGKTSPTYSVLKKIINEDKTVVKCGKDEAFKVKIDTALSINDFYNQENQLISTKVNEGGFVNIVSVLDEDEKLRNTFKCDMLITNATRVEADPERGIEKDYVVIKGAIFNFRNELLPVDFKVTSESGMDHFESLEASASSPVYTSVWGNINCATIVRRVEEESAFGDAAVRTYERKVRDWVVTGTSKEAPYVFGDEAYITEDELRKLMQDRETKLADIKKRSDEYRASKNTAAASAKPAASVAAPSVSAQPKGQFNF